MTKITYAVLLTIFVYGCVPVEPEIHKANITDRPHKSSGTPDFELYHGAWDDSVQVAADIRTSTEAELQGDQASSRGNKNKAVAFYARAIELDEKNINAGYKLAVLHKDTGNDIQAEQLYRFLLTKSPRHTGILEGLGFILFEQNNIKEAQRLLVKAVAIFERQKNQDNGTHNYIPIKAFNSLGILADRNGNYPQAQTYYQEGLKFMPHSAAVMNNLAYSYFLEGDWKRAETILYEVLSIQPKYTRAIYNLALVNARARRFNKAVELLEHFMSPYEASNDIGYLAMMGGDHASAEELFQQAIDLAPSYHEAAWRNMDKLKQLSSVDSIKE